MSLSEATLLFGRRGSDFHNHRMSLFKFEIIFRHLKLYTFKVTKENTADIETTASAQEWLLVFIGGLRDSCLICHGIHKNVLQCQRSLQIQTQRVHGCAQMYLQGEQL